MSLSNDVKWHEYSWNCTTPCFALPPSPFTTSWSMQDYTNFGQGDQRVYREGEGKKKGREKESIEGGEGGLGEEEEEGERESDR